MAVLLLHVPVNTRAALWLHFLARQKGQITAKYVNQVLLKHLNETPGVDLSQSPYSEPKGVSDVKEG